MRTAALTPAENQYKRLWVRIRKCERCHADERICGNLRDDFVPLPGPGVLPPGAKYVAVLVVGTEPSAARPMSREKKNATIDAGHVNFDWDADDLALKFALEHWLVPHRAGAGYILTDLGKCTIPGRSVNSTRWERYENCRQHLEREIATFRPSVLLALGKTAERFLRVMRATSWPPVFEIPHHSWRFPRRARRGSMRHVHTATVCRFFKSRWNRPQDDTRSPPRVTQRVRRRLALYYETLTDLKRELRRGGIDLTRRGAAR